jgi:hypothetical protein
MKNGVEFFDSVAKSIERARAYVGRTTDLTMCVTYFEIGRMIVEEEQDGKSRATYGSDLLRGLSAYLADRVGRGFSLSNLEILSDLCAADWPVSPHPAGRCGKRPVGDWPIHPAAKKSCTPGKAGGL